jgi:hypothetical protein
MYEWATKAIYMYEVAIGQTLVTSSSPKESAVNILTFAKACVGNYRVQSLY